MYRFFSTKIRGGKALALASLVALNAMLLAAIVMATVPERTAQAQVGGGLAGQYLVVAGEIQDQFDAVYMIDVRARALHAFTFDRGTKQLELGDSRDLERDFRNNRD